MNEFWQVFKESHVITGLLAVILTITASIIWVRGGEISEILKYLLFVTYGYFFGARLYEGIKGEKR